MGLTTSVASLISTTPPDPSAAAADRSSDTVLAHLRPGLQAFGYEVETGKAGPRTITRPVLHGYSGVPEVSYDINAFHDSSASRWRWRRGAANGADYRNIIRTALHWTRRRQRSPCPSRTAAHRMARS